MTRRLPLEMYSAIFEYACDGADGGHFARVLGEVSRLFRSVALPLEFRVLSLSGPVQMRRGLARVVEVKRAHGVVVKHLFLCDFEARHGLAMKTHTNGMPWVHSREGREVLQSYSNRYMNTRMMIIQMVEFCSASLRSLCLLCFTQLRESAESGIDATTAYFLQRNAATLPSLLDAPRRLVFPRLKEFVLKEPVYLDGQKIVVNCEMPVVERMHLIGPWYAHRELPSVHPLLEHLGSKYPMLTHIRVSDATFEQTYKIAAAINDLLGSATPSMAARSSSITLQKAHNNFHAIILQPGRCGEYGPYRAYIPEEYEVLHQDMKTMMLRTPGMHAVRPPTSPYLGQYGPLKGAWEQSLEGADAYTWPEDT